MDKIKSKVNNENGNSGVNVLAWIIIIFICIACFPLILALVGAFFKPLLAIVVIIGIVRAVKADKEIAKAKQEQEKK